MATELSQIREEFIEATCPIGASQEQIQDMQMAFDAGAFTILTLIVSTETENFHAYMDELYKEAHINAQFHAEEGK